MVHHSDRDPRPGDDCLAIAGCPIIPAVLFAPLSGCSRQHWRLVCVPLRHVLPIGVSRFRGIRPPNPRSSPTSGGRPLQRAGDLHLRQCLTPAPAPPRLTSHRQVYPRAGQPRVYERKNGRERKNVSGFEFVGESLEFIPLRLRELRGFLRLARRPSPPLVGEKAISMN
jgi:hypothetical protein